MRPLSDRPVPTSTYRIQVTPDFGFAEVARQAPYLAGLGVSHVYLSPVLQPVPGSTHGYDVLDHSRLNEQAGGRQGFEAMVDELHRHGLRLVVDVVPNHMAVPTPLTSNPQLWSVLREGPDSEYAHWFDIDWGERGGSAVLMPVLGERIGTVLAQDGFSVDTTGDEPVLRYYDHVFPLRAGTEDLPMAELLDRQFYRLAHWKVADEELNYRRFFDVNTLAAVRVEDPQVFDATHRLLLDLYHEGQIDGFRIDHPDGLAQPRAYLQQLARATDHAWVVVEKILEGDEELPVDWPCAGTTGYDALQMAGGLLVDPSGAAPLLAQWAELAGRDTDARGECLVPPDVAGAVEQAKRQVAGGGLRAEVDRLVDLLVSITAADLRLRDHTRRGFTEVVVELLVVFDRYRAYVVPGEPAPTEAVAVVDQAAAIARTRLDPDRHDTLDLVRDLVLGRPAGSAEREREAARDELVVRFQQTCGPVMAKGIEDTAFYRWYRLAALNEVGGDPGRFGVLPEEFHVFCDRALRHWPTGMTTLSTHDTKRSEDTRAQLAVLSQRPDEWREAVTSWRAATREYRGRRLDNATEYLFWQTLVGTWDLAMNTPIGLDRLQPYLEKAIREAKLHTTWTAPDEAYETDVHSFAREVLADAGVLAEVGAFMSTVAQDVRAGVLGQKLLQLTMPGVPDVYQGTEVVDRSLVDPDNRRPVDYESRLRRLHRLDEGQRPEGLDDEKLRVTSAVLRLRRDHPDWFVGERATFAPIPTTTSHLVAFGRGGDQVELITLVTRLPAALARAGGWGTNTVSLPAGRWRDELTGTVLDGGDARIGELLQQCPVTVLVRD